MPNRYLVIVRAGDTSLHPHWTSDLASRDWDLLVSYFGSDPARYRDPGELRIDDPGMKWTGLHALLTRTTSWRNYDYIWCPDDDLAASQESVSRFFALVAGRDLWLAQPALSWQSHYSHPITVRHPSFKLRYTNFVEIMAPCFKRSFLEQCLPTFLESQSGWGLDRVWPSLLPEGTRHAGIVDEVEVTHTRPVGGPSYASLREMAREPSREFAAVVAKHQLGPGAKPRILGALDAHGSVLEAASPETVGLLRQLAASDMATFLASPDRPPWVRPGRSEGS